MIMMNQRYDELIKLGTCKDQLMMNTYGDIVIPHIHKIHTNYFCFHLVDCLVAFFDIFGILCDKHRVFLVVCLSLAVWKPVDCRKC